MRFPILKSRSICCIKCVCIVIIIYTFSACLKTSNESWSISEIKALVGFIVSHGEDRKWAMHHRMEFWDSAALFVMNQAGTSHQRSGNFRIQFNKLVSTKFVIAGSSSRYKVVKWLKKKFSDPKSAEIFYISSLSVGVQVSITSSSKAVQTSSMHNIGVEVGVQTNGRIEVPVCRSVQTVQSNKRT